MVRFFNYSGSMRQEARAARCPRDLEALRETVRGHDPAKDGRLTIRATGNSLHNQALGTGVVVQLDDMTHSACVTVGDAVQRRGSGALHHWSTAEVTGWTPWELVVRATLRLPQPDRWTRDGAAGLWRVDRYAEGIPSEPGNRCFWRRGPGADPTAPMPLLLPYTLVSSGRITAAGSLSSDAAWRFSAVLGRECDSVVWLDLLTSDGSIRRLFNGRWGLWEDRDLHPGAEPASSRAENDTDFDAVVGGFGLLGVVVGVKYLLLELDPCIAASDFTLSPPVDGGRARDAGDGSDYPLHRDRECRRGEKLLRRAEEADVSADDGDGSWPAYPHAPARDLGRTGDDIEPRALTWMWRTDAADVLLATLAAHRRKHEPAEGGPGEIRLARKVSRETVACFAIVFANSRHAMQSVVGNIAYGLPPDGAKPFKLWDRRYGWKNTARILDFHLLPWAARIGEWVVYRSVFVEGMKHSPTANPIPEFAFFMEGHSVAMAEQRRKPETLQQAWTIPIELDEDGRCVAGAELFADFLAAIKAMSQRRLWLRNAVRVQVCDVKCVPPGRALLSSSRGVNSMMVTVTVENVRGYRWFWGGWGSPRKAFRALTREFAPRGVKLHLSKNLHARAADLETMYGDAFRSFRTIKRRLDPKDLWSSDLLPLLEG